MEVKTYTKLLSYGWQAIKCEGGQSTLYTQTQFTYHLPLMDSEAAARKELYLTYALPEGDTRADEVCELVAAWFNVSPDRLNLASDSFTFEAARNVAA